MTKQIEVIGPVPDWISLKDCSEEEHYTAYSNSENKYASGKTREEAIKNLNQTLDKPDHSNI